MQTQVAKVQSLHSAKLIEISNEQVVKLRHQIAELAVVKGKDQSQMKDL